MEKPENQNNDEFYNNSLINNTWLKYKKDFDSLNQLSLKLQNNYKWIFNYKSPFSDIEKSLNLWSKNIHLENYLNDLVNNSNYIKQFTIYNKNFEAINDSLKGLQNFNAIKEISAQQSAILKIFNSQTLKDFVKYQQQIIEDLENFNIAEESPQGFVNKLSENNFEEQLEVIKNEPNSKIKDYLKQNHLAILTIIIPIVFFIWQNCINNNIENQNNKIISLLEQNKKIHTELVEGNEKNLSNEQVQTELIITQTELLKEMLIEIKSSNTIQNNK